jgi:hypothetical protein
MERGMINTRNGIVPRGRAAARPPQQPMRERYLALLRQMEENFPHLAGLAQTEAGTDTGVALKFRLEEENGAVRIEADVGMPAAADALRLLREMLAMNLNTPLPAFWTVGWDERRGFVLVSHFRIDEDLLDPCTTLTMQVDICLQIVLGMRKELLGADDAPKAAAGPS